MSNLSLESYNFIADLSQNNQKAWFEANRERYEKYIRQPLKELAEALAEPLSAILPEYHGRIKISRINNDIRFAPHKPPYKTHMWLSMGAGGEACADLFFTITSEGWAVGCGTTSARREPLEEWRLNLLNYAERWRRYINQAYPAFPPRYYYENPYKKPLFDDLPEDLKPLIQARGVWLVTLPRKEFKTVPSREIITELGRVLPLFWVMSQPASLLLERIDKLHRETAWMDGEVRKLWEIWIKD